MRNFENAIWMGKGIESLPVEKHCLNEIPLKIITLLALLDSRMPDIIPAAVRTMAYLILIAFYYFCLTHKENEVHGGAIYLCLPCGHVLKMFLFSSGSSFPLFEFPKSHPFSKNQFSTASLRSSTRNSFLPISFC